MHAGGMGLQEIFANLPDGDDNNETDEYVRSMLKLDQHFCMKRNTTVERYIFRKIRQLSEESIEKFVMRLRAQLSRCDFGAQEEEHLRDQIIEGTCSEKLRENRLC